MKKIVSLFTAVLLITVLLSQPIFSLDIFAQIFSPKMVPEIPDNKWYSDAVNFVIDEYLFLGDDKGNYKTTNIVDGKEVEITYIDFIVFDFAPNKPATRIELLKTIYLYDGNRNNFSDFPLYYDPSPAEYNSDCIAFKDVSDGTWDAVSAQWGYDNGITNGVGGGYFKPASNVTREEFVTMVYRFAQKKGVDMSSSDDTAKAFDDYGKVSKWARDAMDWACEIGLINGKTKTMIKPRDNVTRAEMAMIIYRFNNLVIAHDDLCPELQ